ncbi:MAG: hypothetical protein DRP47_06125, partial [Candidatus Zixiibacteriota bacterium]
MTPHTHKQSLLMLGVGLIVSMIVVSCMETTDYSAAIERHKKLAGELRDNRLYEAAIDEYSQILNIEGVDDKTRANIHYLTARIYYDHLQNYEKAAANYVCAQSLDPDASYAAEASRKLVASLEKMGNIVNAKRQLDNVVNLDAGPRNDKDVVVARIGGVPVYMSEIDDQIQTLPPEIQKQYLNRKAKIEFVHQHVGVELLYHAAVRENYGDDPEVKRRQHLFYKQLLVDRYVVDKVIPQVQIDTSDVSNFYLANKSKRYQDAPYDSVKAQVFLDYQ